MRLKEAVYIIFTIIFIGCDNNPEHKAKEASEDLLNAISNSNAYNLFPEKYFPNRNEITNVLNNLRNNCDFANRKGNYINDYYANRDDYELAVYIYEYHLKCNDFRFVITYKIYKKDVELFGFKVESIKDDNAMITHPENRLWKDKSNSSQK